MLTLRYADKASTGIPRADVARYPGSLLHTMMTDTAPDDDSNVEVELSSLTGNPLADWAEAAVVSFIADIYRLGYIGAATLAPQLSTQTPPALVEHLQQLLDYLALPGPVLNCLPPCSAIPLRHVGLLKVRWQALAVDAVNTIMASCTLSPCADINITRAIAFCFAKPASTTAGSRLEVYAVSSSPEALGGWADVNAIKEATHAQLLVGSQGGKSSGQLVSLTRSGGSDIASRAVSDSYDLPLTDALVAAVAAVPCHTRACPVRTATKPVIVSWRTSNRGNKIPEREMPVWVVYW